MVDHDVRPLQSYPLDLTEKGAELSEADVQDDGACDESKCTWTQAACRERNTEKICFKKHTQARTV